MAGPLRAEGPPWQNISNIRFSNVGMAFILKKGNATTDKGTTVYYEKKDSPFLTEITEKQFLKYYPVTKINPSPKKAKKYTHEEIINPEESIRATYDNCHNEGEGGDHCFGINIVTDNFKFTVQNNELCKKRGCVVYSANIIDQNIWLGFGVLGEYEWYGYGVQAYDTKTYALKYSTEKDERYLASEFVKNPINEKIIIATNVGIQEIDLKNNNAHITNTISLDFDPESGKIRNMMNVDAPSENILAIIGKDLGYENDRSFYDAIKNKISGKNLFKYKPNKIDIFLKEFDLNDELVPFIVKGLKSKNSLIKLQAATYAKYIKSKDIYKAVYDEIIFSSRMNIDFSDSNPEFYLAEVFSMGSCEENIYTLAQKNKINEILLKNNHYSTHVKSLKGKDFICLNKK